MSERIRAVLLVSSAHLTVWWAELRERLGGGHRRWLAVVGFGATVVVLAGVSFSLAPNLSGSAYRERTALAAYPVILIVGALVWTAFSLVLPDVSAVDTLLTAVPSGAGGRRMALGIITLVPALLVATCMSLVLAGGLITSASGLERATSALLTSIICVVLGAACGSVVAGSLTWVVVRARLMRPATARGLASTAVVALAAVGLLQVMGAVGAPASASRPLTLVGQGAVWLEARPVSVIVAAPAVLLVGCSASLAGVALGRDVTDRANAYLSDMLTRRRPARRLPSLPGLEGRQLWRYQPNVGLGVMLVSLIALLAAAGRGRSPVLVSSAYFGLGSLATTSAVTVAGVNGAATWLYVVHGRMAAHVTARLAAFLGMWVLSLAGLAWTLVLTTDSFRWVDAVSVWPLMVIELAVVLALGALLPVSEEQGVSGASTELCALVAILVLAFGLPRIEVLTSSTAALIATSVVASGAGIAVFVWRAPRARTWATGRSRT